MEILDPKGFGHIRLRRIPADTMVRETASLGGLYPGQPGVCRNQGSDIPEVPAPDRAEGQGICLTGA
jgi:hypothetical protein